MNYKTIVSEFLMNVAKGNVEEAFGAFVSADFKHHNAYFEADNSVLINAMKASATDQPHKIFTIKHIIEDHDMVAVHSHLQMNEKHSGYATMHIFKIKNDKIIEMWDFGQEVPNPIINTNGMF
ncbi:nuclear transport factor 2 family protein [Zhouia sp. PK063]|uniref:nuclear transport factor 2 family protein n=1 Tax=Zhouia sp. PK063 TaxID=3373602 RepID=UPI0037A78985